jgi:alpha-tubulin suppressor-like RCC1 family protein
VTRRKTLPLGNHRPVAVSVGDHHSLALDEDGKVWAWGDNSYGQLGTGDTTLRDRPTQVQGIGEREITAIAAGWESSFALDADGTVWSWGWGGWNILGNGKDDQNMLTPGRVSGLNGDGSHLTGVTAIAAGYAHGLALLADGTVAAWGTNIESQCGQDPAGGTLKSPKLVLSESSDTSKYLSGAVQVAAGRDHSLALLADGTVAAWGKNAYGELGDGTTGWQKTPVKVKNPDDPTKVLSGVRSIAASWYYSIAACDWPSD